MKISDFKKIILKNLERLERTSYRGRVSTFKLWMEFGLSRKKGEDFEKLYRQHQSALQLLTESNEVQNTANKPLSNTEVQLAPKGREVLDVINRSPIKKIFSYFEPQIKSEVFKLIIFGISLIFAYIAGYYKIFIGQ